jgi:hypothetical protein
LPKINLTKPNIGRKQLMAISRPMALSAEPVDVPNEPIIENEGLFGATPVYAQRRKGGSGARTLAMVAIPVAVVAIGAGLLFTSSSNKPLTTAAPVAAPSAPVQTAAATSAPASTAAAAPAAVTPTQVPIQTAEAAPAAMIATPKANRMLAARSTARRASVERAAAPSASDSATDTSATVIDAPAPAPAAPAVIAAPEPMTLPAPAPATPSPTTPPQ